MYLYLQKIILCINYTSPVSLYTISCIVFTCFLPMIYSLSGSLLHSGTEHWQKMLVCLYLFWDWTMTEDACLSGSLLGWAAMWEVWLMWCNWWNYSLTLHLIDVSNQKELGPIEKLFSLSILCPKIFVPSSISQWGKSWPSSDSHSSDLCTLDHTQVFSF